MLSKVYEILKISATPPNIIYPLGLVPLAVYSIYPSNLMKLIEVVVFSFCFQAGVNLWNHFNDVEEDILSGREWSIIHDKLVRSYTGLVAFTLYLLSGLMVYFWQIWEFGIIFFFIAAFFTWAYSDKVLLGRFTRRFKEHYFTEILTYVVSVPSFILVEWSILSSDYVRGFALSVTFLFLVGSGVLLKDLKDISADRKSGFLTVGVVFNHKTLIKYYYVMIYLYFMSIIFFSYFGIYPKIAALSAATLVGIAYPTYKLAKYKWDVDEGFIKIVKITNFSIILSLLLFSTLNIFIGKIQLV